jgi:tRNA-Thr(GGU) m(6)t(6)A37 methyltransferase TsaA
MQRVLHKTEGDVTGKVLTPVAVIRSPFREKFGIPRQPGLIRDVPSQVVLLPPFNREEAVRGLEDFTHLWLIFQFHACPPFDGSMTVRPPRLGGNKRMGVFATRGTHRPNLLGMSVVALERIDCDSGVTLHIKGGDLLDGTPVYDIKPYLHYADAVLDAKSGFAQSAPPVKLQVEMGEELRETCMGLEELRPGLLSLICQVIGQDPRPAFKKGDDTRIYGVKLYDLDVRFTVKSEVATVVEIVTF